jgi:hypothetical protein
VVVRDRSGGGPCADTVERYTVEVRGLRARGFGDGPQPGVAIDSAAAATPAKVTVQAAWCMQPAYLIADLSVALRLPARAITTVEVTFGDSIFQILQQPSARNLFGAVDPYSATMTVTLSDGSTLTRKAG